MIMLRCFFLSVLWVMTVLCSTVCVCRSGGLRQAKAPLLPTNGEYYIAPDEYYNLFVL